MKNLLKLKVILLAFSVIFASKAIAADRILPLPKPAVDKETKIKTAIKKNIYPQKKPEEIIKKTQEKKIKKIEDDVTEKTEEIFIYPQKKPLVVQKKVDKTLTTSTILSKKDYKS